MEYYSVIRSNVNKSLNSYLKRKKPGTMAHTVCIFLKLNAGKSNMFLVETSGCTKKKEWLENNLEAT
jgi:hypothetical protein